MLISLSICDWFIITNHLLSVAALIASFMHDRCSSTQSPSSGDVHPLLIKLMGLLVAALFLSVLPWTW
jgi:hypothetical protein